MAWDGDGCLVGMGPVAHRLWGSGNGTSANPSCLPEPVFLKHGCKHRAIRPASRLLPTRVSRNVPVLSSPLPCSPLLSGVCFPINFPPAIPCTTPVCIPARHSPQCCDHAVCQGRTGAGEAVLGPAPTRLILTEGPGQGNPPCAPQPRLPTLTSLLNSLPNYPKAT